MWERGGYVQSLFQGVWQMRKGSTESQFVKTSPRPARPIHTCRIALLLDTSHQYFSTFLRKNTRIWSGDKNRHWGQKCVAKVPRKETPVQISLMEPLPRERCSISRAHFRDLPESPKKKPPSSFPLWCPLIWCSPGLLLAFLLGITPWEDICTYRGW
jgi:hypothetical protein